MKHLFAIFLIAFTAIPVRAEGQKASDTSTLACPSAAAMNHQHLQGRWLATLDGQPDPVALHLGPHPELRESVRGQVRRGDTTALVSGDVDEGELTLEESRNGTNISATWTGQAVEGSCGKEIRGTWSQVEPPMTSTFVLRKQPGGWN